MTAQNSRGHLDPDALTAFGTAVLQAVAVPEPDARLVAESLVTADLWGHPSHGLLRLDWYVARLAQRGDAAGHTNVLVSAVLFGGVSRQLLDGALRGRFVLVTGDELIVTGGQDLLAREVYRGVPILTPRQFVNRFAQA